MSMIDDVFCGNKTLIDCLLDTEKEVAVLHEIASLHNELTELMNDSRIIENVNRMIELNEKYFLMKCFDSFKLGTSFAFELISESNQFN